MITHIQSFLQEAREALDSLMANSGILARIETAAQLLLSAFSSGNGHLTCVANDFGYDHVFARFLDAQARAGDVLLAISTSGKSANVLKAAEAARGLGMKIISLTDKPDMALGQLADIDIGTIGGAFADRVQELHIKVDSRPDRTRRALLAPGEL